MLRVFEAFSGVGSQRMALRNLGIEHEVVGIAEIDKAALKSYEAIHGDCPNVGDISKVKVEDIPDHCLFTYSFPCQDLSVAGLQKGMEEGSGTRSSLLWECKRIIEGKKPKYLLLENVKNLVGKQNKPLFDKWLEWLDSQGYDNYWKVVNATECNVPQNRQRVFVISIRKDLNQTFEFPQPVELEYCMQDFLEKEVDEKYYLSDKMMAYILDLNETQQGTKWEGRANNDTLNNKIARTISVRGAGGSQRAGVSNFVVEGLDEEIKVKDFKRIIKYDIPQIVSVRKYEVDIDGLQVVLREAKKNSKLTIKEIAEQLDKPLSMVEHWFRTDRFFSIPDADVWEDLKALLGITTPLFDLSITTFEEREGVFEKSNRVYDPQGISPTLTATSSNERILERLKSMYRIRKLTPWETWALMTFSREDYEKAAKVTSDAQLYKQSGNSIPTKVLEALFRCLLLGGN